MRLHRRSTSTRIGRRGIAPVTVSLFGGIALVGGLTVASTVGAAPLAGASSAHALGTAQPPKFVQQPGQQVPKDKSTHLGQAAPMVSSTPHVVAHNAINQTLTVDNNGDPNTGTPSNCAGGNANTCTLRDAIAAANADYPSVDAINIPAGYDIQLTSDTPLVVNNSMFISGVSGGAAPVIDGQGNTGDFVLYSTNDGFTPAVQLGNLTIQGGNANASGGSNDGGDIYLENTSSGPPDLTLSSVTVTTGQADDGGAIYVDSGASLWTDAGTTISNSTATSDCGGGIYNDGSLSVSGSTINGNSASSCGGGLYNDGAAALDTAQITNNSANYGGAVENEFSLNDNGSNYNGNNVGTSTNPMSYASGAVLYNDDAASLTNVTISNSQAWTNNTDLNGGVFYNEWQLSLTNVSVANTTNRADGNNLWGGVIDNEATLSCCPYTYGGNLSVNGLYVSGTSNGASGVDTEVDGGVIYNNYKAALNGLTVSSTTNNTGADDLFGGVGDVGWVFDNIFCPYCGFDYAGSTAYQTVNVSGTTNVGTGDDYHQGGVFDTFWDFYNNGPLSGNIADGTITGTSDSIATGELDGGVVATLSSMSLSNLAIDSTTVNAAGGSVYGGAVGTLYHNSEPDMSANDVSVTNTSVTNVGGGNGYVEGGAWYNSDELNATGVQVLGTTVTSDQYVNGGALSNDGDASNITNSTFAGTNVTVQGGGGSELALALESQTNLTNVTVDDNSTSAGADVIYLENDPSSFTNVTIANNTVGANSDGIYADASAHFKNTIVQTNNGPDCVAGSGSFTSDGGNIDSGNTCNFTQPSDQVNVVNPGVNAVANNGGPVQTAALQPGSPAIGRGVSAGCPSTDARGVARPAGSCDVGAFQLSKQGYWMVASDGGIFNFANAGFYGSMGATPLNSPIVGMAITPDGKGYWEVASDGGIFTFGDAVYYGSMGGKKLNKPVVGMAATPDGKGYWLVATDGGIFSFGDAQFHGSTGAIHLNKPVVGMAATPSGGYWLVASDGGIFNYGPGAGFFGSAGAIHLNKPVVGMAASPGGKGYWLVASDGGIFTYGPGPAFYGSTGAIHLNKPVVGMAATPSGDGYWLFASDGGVFNYGDATFQGSMGGTPLQQPVNGGAANPID